MDDAQFLDGLKTQAEKDKEWVDNAEARVRLEKVAYLPPPMPTDGPGNKGWLGLFEGTPLLQQAIALERQELTMQAEDLARRQTERQQGDSRMREDQQRWDLQDQIRLKKKELELQLAEQQLGGAGGGEEVGAQGLTPETMGLTPQDGAGPKPEAGVAPAVAPAAQGDMPKTASVDPPAPAPTKKNPMTIMELLKGKFQQKFPGIVPTEKTAMGYGKAALIGAGSMGALSAAGKLHEDKAKPKDVLRSGAAGAAQGAILGLGAKHLMRVTAPGAHHLPPKPTGGGKPRGKLLVFPGGKAKTAGIGTPLKGALIGGAGGALTGALLDKEDPGSGALAGGLGVAGALTGRHVGKKLLTGNVQKLRRIGKVDNVFKAQDRILSNPARRIGRQSRRNLAELIAERGGPIPGEKVATIADTLKSTMGQYRDPRMLGAMGIGALSLGLLANRGSAPRADLGGKSKSEVSSEKALAAQQAGGDDESKMGLMHKLKRRMTEVGPGVAKAMREHPLKATALGALGGAQLGQGLFQAAGKLKQLRG